eukprot:TRINITY_DN737_c0_g2_i1.p1 TRINITY_DN737_c0_g2~~TRINITY_DN737_c0_g2_i1.p1  ORF type:complete len:313 (-),score=133.21 TRINITY_DN737_c0_g2_i1:653-1591(-)
MFKSTASLFKSKKINNIVNFNIYSIQKQQTFLRPYSQKTNNNNDNNDNNDNNGNNLIQQLQETIPERQKNREIRKKAQRKQQLDNATKNLPSFKEKLEQVNLYPFLRKEPTILQVNLGKLCNLACHHCHVESSPTRVIENLNGQIAERIISLLRNSKTIHTLDLTGGAPELNPHFRYIVQEARKIGIKVIDRCNLTVLFEPGQETTAQFLRDNQVAIVASLPCYSPANVDKQRGDGVFEASLKALKLLNELGYANENLESNNLLELHLVYNPIGPTLPASQQTLEIDYKRELKKYLGISFTSLFTITNMPSL